MRTPDSQDVMTVTPSQAAEILRRLLPLQLPVLLVGEPGSAKSSLVQQVAEKLGARLLTVYPALSDPTDYKGCPCVVDGIAHFLPFDDLRAMIEHDTDQLFIVFLDEIGQAMTSVQAALMSLLLARRIGDTPISSRVAFVAATNRATDQAGVQQILSTVLDRFGTVLHIGPSRPDWLAWAAGAGIRADVQGFVQLRPDVLNAWKPTRDMTRLPTRRGLEQLSRILDAMDGANPELMLPTVAGIIGQGWAAEFIAFQRLCEQLPDPDLLIADPSRATLPAFDGPGGIGTWYALAIAIANRLTRATAPAIHALTTRDDWPSEMRVLLWELAVRRDGTLIETREHTAFALKCHKVYL